MWIPPSTELPRLSGSFWKWPYPPATSLFPDENPMYKEVTWLLHLFARCHVPVIVLNYNVYLLAPSTCFHSNMFTWENEFSFALGIGATCSGAAIWSVFVTLCLLLRLSFKCRKFNKMIWNRQQEKFYVSFLFPPLLVRNLISQFIDIINILIF